MTKYNTLLCLSIVLLVVCFLISTFHLEGFAEPVMAPVAQDTSTVYVANDLPAATVTTMPIALISNPQGNPLTMGTQQVADMNGTQAAASIQNKVVPTDSMPAAVVPTSGSVMGPTMGPSSCMDSSMDSCEDDCGCNSGDF
jgi:hypothetical protein